MNKILAILHKEWLEMKQQRLLLAGIIVPPLIFTAVPIIVVALLGVMTVKGNVPHIPTTSSMLAGMNVQEAGQALLGMQMSNLYVLLPVLMTSIIASYSIVGEKTSRTLEPVLATPVRTWELLLAKGLVALIPGIGMNWLCGTIFIIAMAKVAISDRVFAAIVSPGWLIVFLLWTPLLSLIAIAVMVAVSSRVNDPRTAQQFSAWALIPFFGLLVGQITGIVVLGPIFSLSIFVLLLPLTVLSIGAMTKIFQRETILTRWK